jgi:peptidoglycan hydrolase-like protein with peptidoglycan-binding domain
MTTVAGADGRFDQASDAVADESSAELAGPRRRWQGWLASAMVLLLAGGVGGWALRTILEPAPDVLASPGFTLVTAQQGEVGQSVRLNASAQWVPEHTAIGHAAGVVTTVDVDTGAPVAAGGVLFTVDLRPVVAAAGEVPAFRDLGVGARGADVAQVQRMLADLGHYPGTADGTFGQAVSNAVRAWQRDLGVTVDGVVRRGDVVFVPDLPARLALPDDLTVGRPLSGGEPVVHVLPDAPEFTIALPDGQARLVATGMAVDVSHDGGSWPAAITAIRQHPETGGQIAVLAHVDGGPVCADECAQVPLGEATLLPSVIHVVPQVAGVVVPASAVVSTSDGQTVVVTAGGELVPVTVEASASGMAVVGGVEAGTQVRTPGQRAGDSAP